MPWPSLEEPGSTKQWRGMRLAHQCAGGVVAEGHIEGVGLGEVVHAALRERRGCGQECGGHAVLRVRCAHPPCHRQFPCRLAACRKLCLQRMQLTGNTSTRRLNFLLYSAKS